MNRFHALVNRLVTKADTARVDDYRKTYDLATDFRFNGRGILFYGPGLIRVGMGSYVGQHSSIQAAEGQQVVIGSNCAISHGVRLYTESRDADYDLESNNKIRGDIVIGDNVWIGMNVLIGPGIIVGENSVIGANSVVTQHVAPWTIVGGVPARLIRRKRHAPQD